MPFEIDLNETPLSSPRDSLLATELSPSLPSLHCIVFLDINVAPLCEIEPDELVESINSGYGNIFVTLSFDFCLYFIGFNV